MARIKADPQVQKQELFKSLHDAYIQTCSEIDAAIPFAGYARYLKGIARQKMYAEFQFRSRKIDLKLRNLI